MKIKNIIAEQGLAESEYQELRKLQQQWWVALPAIMKQAGIDYRPVRELSRDYYPTLGSITIPGEHFTTFEVNANPKGDTAKINISVDVDTSNQFYRTAQPERAAKLNAFAEKIAQALGGSAAEHTTGERRNHPGVSRITATMALPKEPAEWQNPSRGYDPQTRFLNQPGERARQARVARSANPGSFGGDSSNYTRFNEGEESSTEFYVYIGREGEGSWIGRISKDGGKWREEGGEGTKPHNWGTSYMSYLSPDEVMQWIRQDYRRHEVAGPFLDDAEAFDYAEQMGGLDEGVAEGQEVDASVVIGKLYDVIDHAEDIIKNADYDRQVQYATVLRDRAVKALNMIKQGGNSPEAALDAFAYMQSGEQGVAEAMGEHEFKSANGPVSVTTEPGRTVVKRKEWDNSGSGSDSDSGTLNAPALGGTRKSDYDSGDYSDERSMDEAEQQKGADYRDPPEADYGDDYQAMVKRMKQLAGAGPLKTQYDPAKRVYKNMPTATQPGAKK